MTEVIKWRCIGAQNDARAHAYDAQHYMEHGLLGRAAQEQREAAYHYQQAWMRLARLIGVDTGLDTDRNIFNRECAYRMF